MFVGIEPYKNTGNDISQTCKRVICHFIWRKLFIHCQSHIIYTFYLYQLLTYFNSLKIMSRELRCEKDQELKKRTIRKYNMQV
jgi:hypothetical protein